MEGKVDLIFFYIICQLENLFKIIEFILAFKGAGGGLHRNSLEIDFIVVSDRGEWYLSAAFGPMEKFCS